MRNKNIHRWLLAALLVAGLTGCGSQRTEVQLPEAKGRQVEETLPEETHFQLIEGLEPLTPEGPDGEQLRDYPVPEPEPAPEYLRGRRPA